MYKISSSGAMLVSPTPTAADGGDLDDDSSPHKKARTSLVTSHVIPVHAPAPAPARPLAPSPYRDALNKAASSNPTGSGPAASVGRPAAAARPVLVAHRPRTRSVTLASAAAANDMALDRRDSMLGGAPAAAAAASAPVWVEHIHAFRVIPGLLPCLVLGVWSLTRV